MPTPLINLQGHFSYPYGLPRHPRIILAYDPEGVDIITGYTASFNNNHQAKSDTKQTLSVARDVFEAFQAHDLDAFRTLLADDAVLRDPSSDEVQRGPDAIVTAVKVTLDAIPDLHPEVENLFANGERAAAEVARTGTHTGELELPTGAVPPTGRKVRLPESVFLRVRGGEVVSITTYVVRMHVMEELGLAGQETTET